MVLNQMCGRLAWETAEDIARQFGPVAMLTGQIDTLERGSTPLIALHASSPHVQRKGSVARLWSWLRFWWRSLFWLFRWSRTTPALYFTNPPILPWVGWIHRLLRGQRYAVIFYDIYPDYLVNLGALRPRGFIASIWRWLNRRTLHRAEAVITLGAHMAEHLARQFNDNRPGPRKIIAVYPWANTDELRPLPKAENPFARAHGQADKLTIMYSGNMGIGHDLDSMLAAAERMQPLTAMHFMFIGGGPRSIEVRNQLSERRLANASFLDLVPEDQLRYSLSTADVALVSLENTVAGLAVPSKAFTFLSVGAPLVVICSQACELLDIVREYQCGWIVTPGNVDQLCDLLTGIASGKYDLAAMKMRARHAAEQIGSRRNTSEIVAALDPLFYPK
ncbi:MAG: glycosyltransferase family 4 protein [Pirellulales bacterium]|nr:glycosyltransferase family 4 protein [Pirellulales bacterium]